MTTKEKIWGEVERNFDWERVHKVMTYLDWKWRGVPGGIPEIFRLKASAKRLFDLCWEESQEKSIKRTRQMSTGGFKVSVYENGYTDVSFILGDWQADPEELQESEVNDDTIFEFYMMGFKNIALPADLIDHEILIVAHKLGEIDNIVLNSYPPTKEWVVTKVKNVYSS